MSTATAAAMKPPPSNAMRMMISRTIMSGAAAAVAGGSETSKHCPHRHRHCHRCQQASWFSARADLDALKQQPSETSHPTVHPLSRLVLREFQTLHHDWIIKQNLQDSLVVNKNPNGDATTWTCYDRFGQKHWLLHGSEKFQHWFLLHDNLLPPFLPDRSSASTNKTHLCKTKSTKP